MFGLPSSGRPKELQPLAEISATPALSRISCSQGCPKNKSDPKCPHHLPSDRRGVPTEMPFKFKDQWVCPVELIGFAGLGASKPRTPSALRLKQREKPQSIKVNLEDLALAHHGVVSLRPVMSGCPLHDV